MDDFSIKRKNQGIPSDTPEHWRVSPVASPFFGLAVWALLSQDLSRNQLGNAHGSSY